ncbi:MAG: hypothetical protein CME67_06995 [Halobacteriovoraceae bacterium]|nr:hypothetical protein [Halobacteriovoraceae bacterium]|tara:strand:- start:171 stop:893 length:723 start_codon:yes stop_codon:yes gene_type:complete
MFSTIQLILVLALFGFSTKAQVDITLASLYSDKRVYRGALVWDEAIFGVAPNFVFFKKINLGRGGLSYFVSPSEGITYRIGYNYFDDNRPGGPFVQLGESEEDFKNQRAPTSELYFELNLRKGRGFSSNIQLSKDILRHSGVYFYSDALFGIAPFVSAGLGAGVGDVRNNQYVYGPEGEGGVGHVDGIVSAMLPFLPFKGRLILSYRRIQISKQANIDADYVRGEEINRTFSAIALWNLN